MKQQSLLKKESQSYGGSLQTKRKGRKGSRPLGVRSTMHLVMRSSKAKGSWSFRYKDNYFLILNIIDKFSKKYGVKVIKFANVGNHLHLHIQLTHRHTYRPFIRAISSAISMAITKASRWSPLKRTSNTKRISKQDRFWDYRPFTRILASFREYVTVHDYVAINQLEGMGVGRGKAIEFVRNGRMQVKKLRSG